jgi:hypothetical protein
VQLLMLRRTVINDSCDAQLELRVDQKQSLKCQLTGKKVSKRSGFNCAILKSGSFPTTTASVSRAAHGAARSLRRQLISAKLFNAVKQLLLILPLKLGVPPGLEMSSGILF